MGQGAPPNLGDHPQQLVKSAVNEETPGKNMHQKGKRRQKVVDLRAVQPDTPCLPETGMRQWHGAAASCRYLGRQTGMQALRTCDFFLHDLKHSQVMLVNQYK
jgi:hypothetical protein